MTPRPGAERVRVAAGKLGQHPQDHGWREFYRLLAHGLATPARELPQLHDLVDSAFAGRPTSSDSHLVALLGIAVKSADPAGFGALVDDRPVADRLARLEAVLSRHRRQVDEVLAHRQNSFTGARRFLVPQVLLAAYFARQDQPASFADLGTGLGVLPRQLNCKTLFDRYAPDLTWPGGRPAYQPIRFAARYAVDRGPFPDQRWVQTCYGPSAYYTAQFRELTEALELPEVRSVEVGYHELDLTDRVGLGRFLAGHGINAVNLSYTLYELDPASRAGVLDTLAGSLHPPGFAIVTEPAAELAQPGCTVSVRDHADPRLRRVCTVSDGHFTGTVRPLEWFDRFVARYPIRFEHS